ncbi:MAG: hypothetical protein KDA75_19145, partial [Planctomycetaceae bacterium]|nr:hypothetical protein [Planctomycetaceae bacterium]
PPVMKSTFRPAAPGRLPTASIRRQTSGPADAAAAGGTKASARATQPGDAASKPRRTVVKPVPSAFVPSVENAERPVPLCNQCGEALDARGVCTGCGAKANAASSQANVGTRRRVKKKTGSRSRTPASVPGTNTKKSLPPLPLDTDYLIELSEKQLKRANDADAR